MSELHQVSDFMVRNPVCASMWQPLSFIRQSMLVNSFSYAFNLAVKSYEQSLRSAIRVFTLTSGNDRIIDRLEVALRFPFADTDEQMEALRKRAGL